MQMTKRTEREIIEQCLGLHEHALWVLIELDAWWDKFPKLWYDCCMSDEQCEHEDQSGSLYSPSLGFLAFSR
jgi:hypothetical protein